MKQWHAIPLKNITIYDQFWNRYTKLIHEKVLPYQWHILNDEVPGAPPSYCLKNLEIAAGEREGVRQGTVFQDSDVAKWLEAVAYSLVSQPNEDLENIADSVIDLIGQAQREDGYLNTYYTLAEPEGRWQNLSEGHELYCAGHLIEAGAAYYEATGKRTLLGICIRFADLICDTFGAEPGQIPGYPGHPEIELALVKLARITGNRRYADTAWFFVSRRGTEPNYLMEEQRKDGFRHLFPEFAHYVPQYAQIHAPVLEQDTAEGHAVRAGYLYCAMADLAAERNDVRLLKQCETLWDNITRRRMYITGSIGSSGFFERFTTDYDLPNDSNYSETCASIALAMFGLRMAAITRNASYMDVVERALYNTVRAGISLEGDRYFYVNPLEVYPPACMEATSRSHVKAVRQPWFDVACCPTNIARTLTSLGQYIYGVDGDEVYLNLFIQNESSIEVGGVPCAFRVRTSFPRAGSATVFVEGQGSEFSLLIRVPEYAENFRVRSGGIPLGGEIQNGYFLIRRRWNREELEIDFDLLPRFVFANPLVRANCGKVALQRGPEIYCLEGCDNGGSLAGIFVDPATPVAESWDENLLGGTTVLTFQGKRLAAENCTDSLCGRESLRFEEVKLTAIPYGSWGNREEGEMTVWMHALL